MTERIFQILAVVLMAAAVYLFWADNKDYGFVALVLSCCSYFLSYRFHLKEKNRAREKEDEIHRPPSSRETSGEHDDRDETGPTDA